AAIVLGILIASPTAIAQQAAEATHRTSSLTTYPGGAAAPLRRVYTRREAAGVAHITDLVEMPGIDGPYEPIQEVVSETTRPETDAVPMRRDLFGFPQRERVLMETTRSERSTAGASTVTVQRTWSPDPNGTLRLISQQSDERTAVVPDGYRTVT